MPCRFFATAFCDIRHLAADHEELFSLQWLERWGAILISLTNFPCLVHYCSYKKHLLNSQSETLRDQPARRGQLSLRRAAAMTAGEQRPAASSAQRRLHEPAAC